MTPPIAIIVRCRCFRPLCSAAGSLLIEVILRALGEPKPGADCSRARRPTTLSTMLRRRPARNLRGPAATDRPGARHARVMTTGRDPRAFAAAVAPAGAHGTRPRAARMAAPRPRRPRRAGRLTLAAVAAYVVAHALFPHTQPLTGPLTALLVVQATLFSTLTTGLTAGTKSSAQMPSKGLALAR